MPLRFPANRRAAWAAVAAFLAIAAVVSVHTLVGRAAPEDTVLPLTLTRLDSELSTHLEFVQLQSRALAGNRLKDPATRELGVLLPPSYFEQPGLDYPVVYLLHGLGQRANGHLDNLYVQRAAFREMSDGELPEFIVVAVDGSTSLGGSYYASSPTIGDFETYVVREVVDSVDARYRTRPRPEARAIAGFSMGGHGAMKLALKYPGVFGEVGTLSGSPLALVDRETLYRDAMTNRRVARNMTELKALYPFETEWTVASIYAKAAAFSPSSRPPLYLELPFQSHWHNRVWEKWADNDPLTLFLRNPDALRSLITIYMDRGDRETILGADEFDRALKEHGYHWKHRVFSGGHVDDYESRHLRMFQHLAAAWVPRS